jgi:hypothetical protein
LGKFKNSLVIVKAPATMATVALTAESAIADTITWHVRSYHRNAVHLKLYSMNRAHQSPTTTAYAQRDYNIHRIRISCVSGERVCFGAYVVGNANSFLGVGHDPRRACSNCCYVCRGNVVSVIHNLNERP